MLRLLKRSRDFRVTLAPIVSSWSGGGTTLTGSGPHLVTADRQLEQFLFAASDAGVLTYEAA
jgi:hypothetical protein